MAFKLRITWILIALLCALAALAGNDAGATPRPGAACSTPAPLQAHVG